MTSLRSLERLWRVLVDVRPRPLDVELRLAGESCSSSGLMNPNRTTSGRIRVGVMGGQRSARPRLLLSLPLPDAFCRIRGVAIHPDTSGSVNVAISGQLGQADTSRPMSRLLRLLEDIWRPLLTDQSPQGVQELTNLIAIGIDRKKHEFAQIIEIANVGLQVVQQAASGDTSYTKYYRPVMNDAESRESKSNPNSSESLENDVQSLESNVQSLESDVQSLESDVQSQNDGVAAGAQALSSKEADSSGEDGNCVKTAERGMATPSTDSEDSRALRGGRHPRHEDFDSPGRSRVYIALGSNVGDRLACIEEACRELNETPGVRLLRTSTLRETKAMYVEDQDPFLNGACEVCTLDGRIAQHADNAD